MVNSYSVESDRSSLESDVSEDENFEVEQVIGRRKKLGQWEYLIKWKGYAVQDNSWEPEQHLVGCSELIDKYNENPKKGRLPNERQSRKKSGIMTPPKSPRTAVQQLQEMDTVKYRVIHQISSPPISPLVIDKRETEFSVYKEAKPQNEEKYPIKDKTFAGKNSVSGLKIMAAIILFLLLILALVKPVSLHD